MANAIMIALGKAKHAGRDARERDPDEDEDSSASEREDKDDGDKPSADEVKAFRELKDALSGDDDEMGALALKNFIRECEGY